MPLFYPYRDQEAQAVAVEPLYEICSNCAVKDLCLPVGFTATELLTLDHAVKQRFTFKRKSHIFQMNDAFQGLYAIQSGAVKCYRINYQGKEEVTGFYLPGELLGLEAIHRSYYDSAAICLTPTRICAITLEQLLEVAATIPSLPRQLLNVMSERLASQEGHTQQRTAEQRVAAFLLSLAYRYRRRGFSAHEFSLPMSRQDIGNYLNLAIETVSRMFSHLQQQGILISQGKHIKRLAIPALEKIVFGEQCRSHYVTEKL